MFTTAPSYTRQAYPGPRDVVVFTLIISLMSCEITQKILKINNLTVYHI